jgi:hypothetical protein
MLHGQVSGPLHTRNLKSTTKTLTTATLFTTVSLLAIAAFSAPAHAQLSLGSVTNIGDPFACPASGWYSYNAGGGTVYSMSCFGATLSSCSNAQDIGFTFGYLSPSGIITGSVKGVIVFFNGSGGEEPAGDATGTPAGEFDFTDYYFKQGYEIVQIAWGSDWEQNQTSYSPGQYGNIQNAACRPATFLNYVYNSIYKPVQQSYPSAGMCAQGASGGSGAVAYSLAYYGAGSWLDNVELISGPVFGDIKQGCQVGPTAPSVTVCGQNGGSQYGCQLGAGGSTWTLSPEYITPAVTSVGIWTNDTSCGGSNSTSSASNLRWWQQSIVDDGTNSPTFTYPNTAMSGWLCRSVSNPHNINCATNFNPNYCPNNTSPQGQIFYAQIGSSNSPPHYDVYAVDQCNGPEGVTSGNVPGVTSNPTGLIAIEQDMAGGNILPAQCFHGIHH